MKTQAASGLRNGPRAWRLAVVLAAGLALPQAPGWAAAQFTNDFLLENCTWSAWGRQNPYLSLRPGRQLVLEGEEDGEEIRAEITVLQQLETISFVTARGVPLTVVARVVEEREFAGGVIVEVSRNWFARCVETGNIFYFGEEVDLYEDGVLVGHEGAWRAGEEGAQPGLIMPASFLLGARYFQEMAPDVAEDRAENTRMGLRVTGPAGTFTDCVEVQETTPLSPSSKDIKVYCPGVGVVKDEALSLVDINIVP
ncbi:MAG TPA: hypothetical protein VGX68_02750 [Thermoanaerobaculia bacterium]|jgi:hypothetical protein|nr:hypothetical protein [Thermoanaerobaculia bacterium]